MHKSGLRHMAILAAALVVLPGLAAAAEVVLYSSNPSELIDLVGKGFEEKTGIKVSVVRLGTGEAMKRIAAEKDKPLCDVFWSGDVAVLENAKENFQTYRSPEAAGLPAGYVEKDARWTASNAHVMIIMVNKALVKEADMPKTWKDLFAPQWKGKVVMANPEKSGSAYAQAYGIYKLYGIEGIQKLIGNAKILDSSSLIYKGVAAGEYPLGVTMEYAAYRYKKGGSPIEVVNPAEGTVAYAEGAGIIKGAPNRENARKFMDWVTSRECRKMVLAEFLRRPAREDLDFAGLAPGMVPLSKIKLLKGYDEEYWIKKQPEVLQKVKDILLRVK